MSSRKNPIRFAVDFASSTIIGTEASLNKARRYGSPEYKELCKLMKAHPQFTVVQKEIAHNKSKETYKNLSFDFIEKYISIQPYADEIKREYEHVKEIAANMGLSVYPYTKSWFLKKFSVDGKPFDMDVARAEINTTRPAAARSEMVA